MFDYIKGKLVDKKFPYCTIEVNSIGYSIFVSNKTLSSIGEIDNDVKIFLKLIHKEDLMLLCGFKTKQERIIFDILTTVSGIGTKAAMTILDEFDLNELINAVIEDDYKTISRAKGIGLKMAQKIVVEIKDKLIKLDGNINIREIKQTKDTKTDSETIKQAIMVLESLGYSECEYKNAIGEALSSIKKDDPEELIKEALKILSNF